MKKSTSGKLALRLTGAITRFILNIIFYLLVVAAIYRGATFLYRFSYEVFGSVARAQAPGTNVPVQIYRGETTMNIATKLETSLVIVDKYSFYVKTKLKEYNIMPGTYILNTSMDYNEILEVITDSKNSIAAEESIESAIDGIGGGNGSGGTENGDEPKEGDGDSGKDRDDAGKNGEDGDEG
ncbi:MAG: hypothetical protein K2N63_11770 [Lachnospiraceae bacterium]|nr:hypothetical protein [Lachnospiraceae bacterium]